MNTPSAMAPVLSSLACAALLWWLLRRPALMDRPNERSLHINPVPRTGGIAIMIGVIASMSLSPEAAPLLGPAALITGVSLIDDWRGLPVLVRLSVHLVAAVWCLGAWMPGVPIADAAVLVLALVWMANLFNFMDGADGLAGGMAVIGFGTYALGAWLSGNESLALASATISAAAVPFLVVNFHPARIFMGDAGSVSLGFMAGAVGAKGWHEGAWSVWFPLLVFSPFIADATLTLLRRLFAGERFWRPHREHYYQKLVRLGLGHRKTALSEYVVMLGAASMALALLEARSLMQWVIASAWFAALLCGAWQVDRRWRQSSVSAEK